MPIYDVEIIFCGTSSQDFSQWWKTETTRVYVAEEDLPFIEYDQPDIPGLKQMLLESAQAKLNWTDSDWDFVGVFKYQQSEMTPEEQTYYQPIDYWDPLV